ncbi:MAG: phage coat protein [Clostridia bacterium]|nr:phage coat protein [Clostridia bacterium]
MGKFDAKSFNEKAFKYSVEHARIPNLKTNELKKSRALKGSSDIRGVFTAQNGTAYAVIAMKGLLDGDAVNYDGQTDITATSTKTFERGVVVVGRAKAWTEKDFADDVSGEKFMDNVADQVAEYWDEIDQDTLLAILDGIFSMTGAKNLEFVNNHTTEVEGNMEATTLNSATNKACGANKKKFTVVITHSDVATNLENLNLVKHLTYTDKDGLTRDIDLGTWNGKLVVIDDEMPVEEVTEGSGDNAVTYNKYTTYVLGDGAIDYENIGAKVPYEMSRDPKTNGGEDTLYTRQRKVFAPYGISYTKKSQVSLSPTDTELKNGQNWELVNSGESVAANRSYINHKAIPIARIISRG